MYCGLSGPFLATCPTQPDSRSQEIYVSTEYYLPLEKIQLTVCTTLVWKKRKVAVEAIDSGTAGNLIDEKLMTQLEISHPLHSLCSHFSTR